MKKNKDENKMLTPNTAENKAASPQGPSKETMNALALLTLSTTGRMKTDQVYDMVKDDLAHLNPRQRIEALKLLVSQLSSISQTCGFIIANLPKE